MIYFTKRSPGGGLATVPQNHRTIHIGYKRVYTLILSNVVDVEPGMRWYSTWLQDRFPYAMILPIHTPLPLTPSYQTLSYVLSVFFHVFLYGTIYVQNFKFSLCDVTLNSHKEITSELYSGHCLFPLKTHCVLTMLILYGEELILF